MHGDWRSLHWGNRKCKPKQAQKITVKSQIFTSGQKNNLIRCLPVYNVTEQLQSLLNAVDGLSHSATLKPVVVFVLRLCEHTAAVT